MMKTKANVLFKHYRKANILLRIFDHLRWTVKGICAIKHFRNHPPIFIVGAARSGTTLLFQLLSPYSHVSSLFEPNKIWQLALGRHPDDAYGDHMTGCGLLKLRGLYYTLLDANAPFLLSKDPKDSLRIDKLSRAFPNAKFIHIVRDGRDVIASVSKIWEGEKYRVDRENDWVHVRIPGYLKLLHQPTHIKAASMWAICVQNIIETFKGLPTNQHITLRYEDLLSDPATTMENVLRFLAWDDNETLSEQFHLVSENVSDKQNSGDILGKEGFAQTWIQSKVQRDAGSGTMSQSTRVGKWKNELSEDALSECTPIIAHLLEYFRYDELPL